MMQFKKLMRRRIRALLLATFAALAIPRAAESILVIDVRATRVSGPAVIQDPEHVYVTGVGAHVEFDVWAHVFDQDYNPLNDGVVYVTGSLFSQLAWGNPWQDEIRGNLHHTLDGNFRGLASQDGTSVDLDGDGDLDVGGTNPRDISGYVFARASSAPSPVMGSQTRIGHGTFDVTALTSAAGGTLIRFDPSPNTQIAADWLEDGKFLSDSSKLFSGSTVEVISQVQPEPTLPALAAVAGFAAALRPARRSKKSSLRAQTI